MILLFLLLSSNFRTHTIDSGLTVGGGSTLNKIVKIDSSIDMVITTASVKDTVRIYDGIDRHLRSDTSDSAVDGYWIFKGKSENIDTYEGFVLQSITDTIFDSSNCYGSFYAGATAYGYDHTYDGSSLSRSPCNAGFYQILYHDPASVITPIYMGVEGAIRIGDISAAGPISADTVEKIQGWGVYGISLYGVNGKLGNNNVFGGVFGYGNGYGSTTNSIYGGKMWATGGRGQQIGVLSESWGKSIYDRYGIQVTSTEDSLTNGHANYGVSSIVMSNGLNTNTFTYGGYFIARDTANLSRTLGIYVKQTGGTATLSYGMYGDSGRFFWRDYGYFGNDLTTQNTIRSKGLIVDSPTIFVDSANHRTGFGIISPLTRIHSYSNSQHQAMFSGWDTTGGANVLNGSIALGNNRNYQGVIHYNGNDDFTQLYFDNTYADSRAKMVFRMQTVGGTPDTGIVIMGNGYVGINGGGVPTRALDVNGDISADSLNIGGGTTTVKQVKIGSHFAFITTAGDTFYTGPANDSIF